MGKLFGTNGVRGVANKELTIEMVTRLASSCGYALGKNIAIGRDYRITSPLFRNAAISGLLSVGCNVHDFGIIPTPALQFSVKHEKLDGGLIITASHNPPQFNGIKVIANNGVELAKSKEKKVEKLYFSGGPNAVSWDKVGRVSFENPLPEYIDAVLSQVNIMKIRGLGFKVALDPGNGTSTLTAPIIARLLGCKVYTINAEPDGHFSARDSEPRPDNLGNLQELVKATNADIGVAFDGDADRSMFINERGEVLWGDQSLAVVAKEYMAKNKGAQIVTPISTSNIISEIVHAAGGSVVHTRVGSVEISQTMLDQGIEFGGEETGGVLYGPHHPVRDGSMALALMLDIFASRGKPLSALVDELPKYAQAKDRVNCPNNIKQNVLDVLRAQITAPKVETIDGLKLIFDDRSWILIRPSGTEPIFRLYAEADNQQRVDNILIKNKRLIEEAVKNFNT